MLLFTFLEALTGSLSSDNTVQSTYITKHDELVIQCNTHRNQSKNTDECFRRLHSAITNAVQLPGETTEETKRNAAKLSANPPA